jgi:hypothetical protein
LAHEAVRDWVGETETFVNDGRQIGKLFEFGQGGKDIRIRDCGLELVEELLTDRRVG